MIVWLKGSGVGVRMAAIAKDPTSAHFQYFRNITAFTQPRRASSVIARGNSNMMPKINRNQRLKPTNAAMDNWGVNPESIPYDTRKFRANGNTTK